MNNSEQQWVPMNNNAQQRTNLKTIKWPELSKVFETFAINTNNKLQRFTRAHIPKITKTE